MPSSECTEVPDTEVLLYSPKSGHLQQLSVYSSLTPLCFCHLVCQVIGNATDFNPKEKNASNFDHYIFGTQNSYNYIDAQ